MQGAKTAASIQSRAVPQISKLSSKYVTAARVPPSLVSRHTKRAADNREVLSQPGLHATRRMMHMLTTDAPVKSRAAASFFCLFAACTSRHSTMPVMTMQLFPRKTHRHL